jgi:hypothetical protein
MFVVTNREVYPDRHDLEAFGSKPNAQGPNELRLAEAERSGTTWKVRILPDLVTAEMAEEVGLSLAPPPSPAGVAVAPVQPVYASRYVARRLLARVNPKMVGKRGAGRNLVLFVHGFNNDLRSVLDRAERFERDFGVEVLVFSWPADGGGAKGVLSYRSDKRDARASVGALDRVIAKMREILADIHTEHERRVEALAEKRFGDDAAAWHAFYTEQAEKWCPFNISLVLHSMGNYLYKSLLTSSVYSATEFCFENVVMVAADTNAEDHDDWVEKIPARKRVFITINERDHALRASCLKLGEAQKVRLGHHLFGLDAKNATYVNFTGAAHVGTSHGYFEGTPLKNPRVKRFFKEAFNGEPAEESLTWVPANKTYKV